MRSIEQIGRQIEQPPYVTFSGENILHSRAVIRTFEDTKLDLDQAATQDLQEHGGFGCMFRGAGFLMNAEPGAYYPEIWHAARGYNGGNTDSGDGIYRGTKATALYIARVADQHMEWFSDINGIDCIRQRPAKLGRGLFNAIRLELPKDNERLPNAFSVLERQRTRDESDPHAVTMQLEVPLDALRQDGHTRIEEVADALDHVFLAVSDDDMSATRESLHVLTESEALKRVGIGVTGVSSAQLVDILEQYPGISFDVPFIHFSDLGIGMAGLARLLKKNEIH